MVTEALREVGAVSPAAVLHRPDAAPVEWRLAPELVPYALAVETMQARVAAISSGAAPELVWLLEHPPLYTGGTSARSEDLLAPARLPVFTSGRGGQFTYHGPGQRVVYVMLDLTRRGRDVRSFVRALESWVIDTLAQFNIKAGTREGRVGVWIPRPEKGPGREDKIAAIGVRVSRWVSFHGISINVSPDLSHYDGIVPCGITDQGVTSFEDLGHLASMEEVDMALRHSFHHHFGPTCIPPPAAVV